MCDQFTDDEQTEISVLMDVLKYDQVLLSKSQLPEIREKKKQSIEKIKVALLTYTGKPFDEKSIVKKIANLKCRVKVKADKNATGNRKIKLQPWEEEFLKLLNSEESPVFQKVRGAMSAGVPNEASNSLASCSSHGAMSAGVPNQASTSLASCSSHSADKTMEFKENSIAKWKKVAKRTKLPETEETQSLSNDELQRLLMLEQLEYVRMKKQRLTSATTPVRNGTFNACSENVNLVNIFNDTNLVNTEESIMYVPFDQL